jgi:predicted transcriptional regulator
MARNDLDICARILEVSRMGARKTQIVYQSNLNFRMVKKYLKRLIEGGLLQAGDRFYITTAKGLRFLEQYKGLIEFS